MSLAFDGWMELSRIWGRLEYAPTRLRPQARFATARGLGPASAAPAMRSSPNDQDQERLYVQTPHDDTPDFAGQQPHKEDRC